jgi:hypothetical protein
MISPWFHVSILFYHPREYHLRSHQWLIQLEVLTQMGDVVLDVGIWESSFQFWASDRVDGPRRSSNEAQNKQSHEAQSDSTRSYVVRARKKKLYERPRSFPPLNYFYILFSPRLIHPSSFSCAPPPSINLGEFKWLTNWSRGIQLKFYLIRIESNKRFKGI